GSGAQTTRYVYDAVGNLRFEVSPEGRVTNYLYSTVAGQAGLLASKITYSRDFYTTTGTLTLTAMTNWLATSTVDQTQA
ncbi:hypothetical protein, partial [Vibrio vulnificus]|uniref:hypothetical protein n=1 Tax=Vibrio vulnificus TaxID=672 RepID=UPI0019F55C3D